MIHGVENWSSQSCLCVPAGKSLLRGCASGQKAGEGRRSTLEAGGKARKVPVLDHSTSVQPVHEHPSSARHPTATAATPAVQRAGLPQHPTGVPVGNRAQLSGCGAGNAVCAHNLHCSLGCCSPHIAERVSDRKCTFLQSRYSLRSRVLLLLVPRCSRRRGKLPKPRDPARGQRQRQLLPGERSGRGRGSAPELRSACEMWVTSSP